MIHISLIYYQVWKNQLYHVLKINNRASDRLETINSQIEPIPIFVIGVVGKGRWKDRKVGKFLDGKNC